MLEPDDYTLKLADRVERRQWSNEVLAALKTEMGQLASTTFEIHAGIEYRAFGLEQALWPVFELNLARSRPGARERQYRAVCPVGSSVRSGEDNERRACQRYDLEGGEAQRPRKSFGVV